MAVVSPVVRKSTPDVTAGLFHAAGIWAWTVPPAETAICNPIDRTNNAAALTRIEMSLLGFMGFNWVGEWITKVSLSEEELGVR
jgi:hypothetical protein